MSTNDVLITPGVGEIKWIDSGGSDFIRIIGDGSLTNTLTFVGDDNTSNGVIFQDHTTDVFFPAVSGLNLGTSSLRWNFFATAGDFSGNIGGAGNLTLSGSSSTFTINGNTAAINMGGSSGLITLSGGSSLILSGTTSSITLSGLSSVLTLAGVTGTNLAPLKFTTGSAPGTSVAGQMWWTGGANLQFAKTNGTSSTFAFTDTSITSFPGILGVANGGTGTSTVFTSGSIIFAGGSGIYNEDNTNLFWDDTNNTLGVGTTRSGAISGTNPLVRIKGSGSTSATSSFEVQNSASATQLFVRNDGHIGINTNTPSYTLDVDSNELIMVRLAQGSVDCVFISHDATVHSGLSGTIISGTGEETGGLELYGNAGISLNTAPFNGIYIYNDDSLCVSFESSVQILHPYGTFAGNTYELHFRELTSNGSNYVGFKAPDSIGTTVTYTLPGDVPSAGEVLTITSYSGGSAVLEWAASSAVVSIGSTITSGTTGSILFIGASSALQQDNANFFWDDTNNTFGVGTTRSGAVSGTNPVTRIKGTGTTSSTSSFEVQNSSAGVLFFVRDDGLINLGTKGTYTESTGQIALSATGSAGGLLIGGDANLYRSAADTLKTDDAFISGSTIVGASSLTLGASGGANGSIVLNGTTSGAVTVAIQNAAGTYNFNLPTTAGTSGYVLTSAGGGASAMTWTDPSGLGVRWNAIANPTGNQSLTMSTNTTTWNWATGTSTNNLFSITTDNSSNGTGAALHIQTGTSSTILPLRIRAAGSTDHLVVNASGQVLISTLTSTRVTFAGTSGLLSDSSNFTYTTGTGQLALATTGSGAGLLIGGDAQIYRSASDLLRTPDSLQVDTNFGVRAPGTSTYNTILRAANNNASTYPCRLEDSTGAAKALFRDDGKIAFAVGDPASISGAYSFYFRQKSTNPTGGERTFGGELSLQGGVSSGFPVTFEFDLFCQSSTAISSFVTVGKFFSIIDNAQTANVTGLNGIEIYGLADSNSAISVSQMTGVYVNQKIGSNTSTTNVGNMKGIHIENRSFTGGTAIVTTHTGLQIDFQPPGGGTSTNYGIRIGTPYTGGTLSNNYGIYLDDQTNATNNYAIFFAGTSGLARQGIWWNADTNLYRSAADTLRTDDAFIAGNGLTVSANGAAITGGISGTTSLTLGANGGTGGTILMRGGTSGTITITTQAAAGTYNFNLPTTAGTSGHVLTSGGGSGTAMTWTDPAALGVRWDAIISPTGNQSLTMSTNTTTWNWATGTSTNNLFSLTTANSSNGTGAALHIQTGTSSTVLPLRVRAAGSTDHLVVNASGQVLVGTLTSTRVTFAGTSGVLSDASTFTFNSGTGQLALSTTGSGGGLLIGGDTQLYRSAADTLRTPDALVVDNGLTINANGASIGGNTSMYGQLSMIPTGSGTGGEATITLNRWSGSDPIRIFFKTNGGAWYWAMGMAAGSDSYNFRDEISGANRFVIESNGSSTQFTLKNNSTIVIDSGNTLLWGSDTNLYRSASDTLRTDDAFIAGNGLTVSANGATITGAISGTTSLTLGANGGTGGSLLLRGSTSGTVTINVAAAAGTWSMTLPTSGGSSGQFLQTNGSGVTTWASAGGISWTVVSGTSQSAAANNGYITNNAALVTVTLPTPAVGTIVEIAGLGAGGWKAQCASGHTIRLGSTVSASTGAASSTNQYDSIRILGVSTTQWHIIDSVGTIDIV